MSNRPLLSNGDINRIRSIANIRKEYARLRMYSPKLQEKILIKMNELDPIPNNANTASTVSYPESSNPGPLTPDNLDSPETSPDNLPTTPLPLLRQNATYNPRRGGKRKTRKFRNRRTKIRKQKKNKRRTQKNRKYKKN